MCCWWSWLGGEVYRVAVETGWFYGEGCFEWDGWGVLGTGDTREGVVGIWVEGLVRWFWKRRRVGIFRRWCDGEEMGEVNRGDSLPNEAGYVIVSRGSR